MIKILPSRMAAPGRSAIRIAAVSALVGCASIVMSSGGAQAQAGPDSSLSPPSRARTGVDPGGPSTGNPTGSGSRTSSQPENLGQAGAGRSGTAGGSSGEQHPPVTDSTGIGSTPTTGPTGPMGPTGPSGTGSR